MCVFVHLHICINREINVEIDVYMSVDAYIYLLALSAQGA